MEALQKSAKIYQYLEDTGRDQQHCAIRMSNQFSAMMLEKNNLHWKFAEGEQTKHKYKNLNVTNFRQVGLNQEKEKDLIRENRSITEIGKI